MSSSVGNSENEQAENTTDKAEDVPRDDKEQISDEEMYAYEALIAELGY